MLCLAYGAEFLRPVGAIFDWWICYPGFRCASPGAEFLPPFQGSTFGGTLVPGFRFASPGAEFLRRFAACALRPCGAWVRYLNACHDCRPTL